MSRIGATAVVGKTTSEIFEIAKHARSQLIGAGSGRIVIDLEWLLEKRVRSTYNVEIDYVSDHDKSLIDAYAAYNCSERVLRIRESVIRKSKHEDPQAVFTLCHEIGHICMHSNPSYFRRENPRHLPTKICDPEWQADRFAIEFLIDRDKLMNMLDRLESAAAYFRVPYIELQKYVSELRAEGVIENKKINKIESHLEVLQGDFDF